MNKNKTFNGIALLVAMFRHFDPETKMKMYKKLGTASPLLNKFVQNYEFMFFDLIRFEDLSMQKLLYKIKDEELVLAMKLTTVDLQKHIFDNMSQRRRDSLKEQISQSSKVRKIQVYSAQQRITKVAIGMMEKGEARIMSRRL